MGLLVLLVAAAVLVRIVLRCVWCVGALTAGCCSCARAAVVELLIRSAGFGFGLGLGLATSLTSFAAAAAPVAPSSRIGELAWPCVLWHRDVGRRVRRRPRLRRERCSCCRGCGGGSGGLQGGADTREVTFNGSLGATTDGWRRHCQLCKAPAGCLANRRRWEQQSKSPRSEDQTGRKRGFRHRGAPGPRGVGRLRNPRWLARPCRLEAAVSRSEPPHCGSWRTSRS